jgi:hypothetical protein
MPDDLRCPNCDAVLLPNGDCPFEGCEDSLPDWVLGLDDEYQEPPLDIY